MQGMQENARIEKSREKICNGVRGMGCHMRSLVSAIDAVRGHLTGMSTAMNRITETEELLGGLSLLFEATRQYGPDWGAAVR
jgi:hypothetical protein